MSQETSKVGKGRLITKKPPMEIIGSLKQHRLKQGREREREDQSENEKILFRVADSNSIISISILK
jgi:hypothetical protein